MGGGGGTCTLRPILCTGLFYPNARIFQHSALLVFVYRIYCVHVLPDLTYWNFFREEGNTMLLAPSNTPMTWREASWNWYNESDYCMHGNAMRTYIYIFMLSYLNELFTHLRTFSDLIIWSTIEGILLQTLIDSILGCAYKRSLTVSYNSPHEAHLKNQRIACVKKGGKSGEIAKGNFSKITETPCWEPPRKGAYLEHSKVIHSISKVGYATAVLGVLSVPSSVPGRRANSVIFEKWPLTDSPYFTLFDSSKHLFLRCDW